MKLGLLCGAGGTGKSSVTGVLQKHKDVTVMRSSSRDTYLRLGIPTETAAFDMDLATQKHLQDEIMNDHLDKFRATVRSMHERNVYDDPSSILIIDRSPFDHMAYWTRTNALDVNSKVQDYLRGMHRIMSFIDHEIGPSIVGFFDFPYPTEWPTNDGMRDQNEIKTLEMSLMTTGLLHRSMCKLKTNNFYIEMGMGTVEARAQLVVDDLNYNDILKKPHTY